MGRFSSFSSSSSFPFARGRSTGNASRGMVASNIDKDESSPTSPPDNGYNKPAITFNGKAIGTTLLGVFGAIVLGVGMCMTMVWVMMIPGIVVGIVGIVALLCLIPVIKGIQ